MSLLRAYSSLSCCYCYHKGTYFRAKHNFSDLYTDDEIVVVATIKVHNFR
ncbi:hypothetical protein HMPREF0973_00353 [Prevotella veroralis F0319]|uniref:Uncharacterized protein n=1 Tax=Prevotella veroralis F0319 TaxID=649761 RepID=C9ML78_9BACT|nr:hypothetical protein HMPREF0973_00353 [Prevotella veroralis F0319]